MMPRPQELDAEIPVIEAIRTGDPYAFREFVDRHHRWVRGVIFAVLGKRDRLDDVAQQVWAGAWQRIGELREPQAWRPWLYRLARNAAIDAGRDASRRRRRTRTLAEEPVASRAATAPDREVLSGERREAVRRAIAALPALYREPFVMRHLSGWSYQQIAEVLKMPVDSVETRLVRARRLLRESLAADPG
jgi:RNA polymerase sigma-70 factor (ECF subfamily)